jgi:hypothetical protein
MLGAAARKRGRFVWLPRVIDDKDSSTALLDITARYDTLAESLERERR